MAFEDFLKVIKDTENSGLPTTFVEDITKAHKEELETRDAKIVALGNTVSEKDSMLTEYKARNYDLIMKRPVTPPSENNTTTNEPTNTATRGVDDIMKDW